MVVVAIQQRNPNWRFGQPPGGVQPAEAAADDDNVWSVLGIHLIFHSVLPSIACEFCN
jgi:hypothetical protein